MLKPFIIVLVLLLCVFSAAAQENQAPPKAAAPGPSAIPADAVHQVNPVKPTSESLAQGKKYYGYDCAMCHGQTGNGKGDVDPGEKLPDFTNAAAMKDKSDGELFCSLKGGKGHMPLENIRVTPNELWNLVNYVRSLGK